MNRDIFNSYKLDLWSVPNILMNIFFAKSLAHKEILAVLFLSVLATFRQSRLKALSLLCKLAVAGHVPPTSRLTTRWCLVPGRFCVNLWHHNKEAFEMVHDSWQFIGALGESSGNTKACKKWVLHIKSNLFVVLSGRCFILILTGCCLGHIPILWPYTKW